MAAKSQYNGRKIFTNILWTVLGLATVVMLGAAINLKHNKQCKGVNIQISGGQNNFFIDKNEINSIIEKISGGSIAGKTLGSFNLAAIENTLRKNQWIKNAELFFDNNQVLRVEVSEREPVARVFTNNGISFYLDSSLARLPLSDKTTARVPVFSNYPGNVNSVTSRDSILLTDIKNIGSYILKDPFWMAQIEQVDIASGNSFEMVPKVGNQLIVFGTADNYREKFANLLTFYRQVATKAGWNTYSKINVQYKNQVVAVKRGAEDMVQDLLRTKQMMQAIVIATQQQVNDSINNIQLEQHDENIIPVAPQLEDIPDEQPVISVPKPAPDTNREVKNTPALPSSNERPDPILTKTNTAGKTLVPDKNKPISKPFWLQAATSRPVSKLNKVKGRSTSNGRENHPGSYRDREKTVVLKPGSKAVSKTTSKSIIKSPTKSTTTPAKKQTTKPRAVMPPPNDY